jgi:transposase
MEILQAYDATGVAHSAAQLAGCDPKTVRRAVARRARGMAPDERLARSRLIDGHRDRIDQLVEASGGKVRADKVHEAIAACGFAGSYRTTRREVAAAKARHRLANHRSTRPWVTMPGQWIQFDWGDGPRVADHTGTLRKTVLFVAWVAWSRFRVVIPCWDQALGALAACLDSMFRLVGGVTAYVLTDNAKTVTTNHVAGLPVRHPLMVELGAHYGAQVWTCVPYDPQSKGGVESSVKIAKADLVPKDANLRGSYASMAELAGACREFMEKVNSRPHSATRRRPVEMLAEEVSFMRPAPEAPHSAVLGEPRVVMADQTVSFGSVRYSVPAGLWGATARVRQQGEEVVVCVDARSLDAPPAWLEGRGLVEVARHKASTPGWPMIDLSHCPGHPQTPDGAPKPLAARPRSKKEEAFCQIGPAAERWLVQACASGVGRIESKMAEAVELAALRGRALVGEAVERAWLAGRYGSGDIASIAEHLSAGGDGWEAPARDAAAAESAALQPGTSAWAGFATAATPGQAAVRRAAEMAAARIPRARAKADPPAGREPGLGQDGRLTGQRPLFGREAAS